jgi:hypothetical protein
LLLWLPALSRSTDDAVPFPPDWTRPGMRDLKDPSRLLPQGEADAYARWLHLDAARDAALTERCLAWLSA